ncbi:hypothetical protein WMO13_00675 [Ignatzschineria larvae DSM 13226]|uniref:Uncharacterized protein n=1 Tax=Ignatzschineria larvae DSM 13226 TaxID=1111732 RepID=A0ABZ3BZX3_9GAMM|nr:hypothetical protein [Ignatzschineria larvae]
MIKNPFLSLLKNDLCYVIEKKEPITIREKKQGGAGCCTFRSQYDVLMIKAKDQGTALWALVNQKCSEGAFLEIKEDGKKVLHIVEMKSKCRLSDFMKVCDQLEGMYYASLAVMAILKLGIPDQVISYVAYKSTDLEHPSRLPLYQNKQLVGVNTDGVRILNFWKNDEIQFKHCFSSLIKGKRDQDGNYDFGTV